LKRKLSNAYTYHETHSHAQTKALAPRCQWFAAFPSLLAQLEHKQADGILPPWANAIGLLF
jgi:hypothetical protein